MSIAHEAEPTIADLILDASSLAEARWGEAIGVAGDNRLSELTELVETLKDAYRLAVAIDAPPRAEVVR